MVFVNNEDGISYFTNLSLIFIVVDIPCETPYAQVGDTLALVAELRPLQGDEHPTDKRHVVQLKLQCLRDRYRDLAASTNPDGLLNPVDTPRG